MSLVSRVAMGCWWSKQKQKVTVISLNGQIGKDVKFSAAQRWINKVKIQTKDFVESFFKGVLIEEQELGGSCCGG